MLEILNQIVELVNIGVAALALFAGIWVVILLLAIAVRAAVLQFGVEGTGEETRGDLTVSRTHPSEVRP